MAEGDKIIEDANSTALGKSLFMRNLRKILIRKGYAGDALEQRINVVLARDPSRLAAVFSGEPKIQK
jgi:hypothetical protein